jgi:tripartite-type tricarboxylate transporter receptor subunit TctC
MHSLTSRLAAMALALLAAPAMALAQQSPANAPYPNKPVRFIVSAAAGGGNDLVARVIAQHMQSRWGQSMVVENRPGAGNNLAAEFVFKSDPDGYTLLASPPAPLVVNKALFKELRFEPEKLEPVSIATYIPNVLAVKPDSQFKTAQELFAFFKANPGKLTYGSQGNGTTGHLTAALMEQLLGARHAHLPYAGAGPALRDLAAGVYDFIFADIGTVMPLTQGEKPVRMLAATVRKAPSIAPSLPTIAEVGMPELQSDTWTAFTAPPGTPLAIREKWSAAIKELMFDPAIFANLAKLGHEPLGLSPKEMADLVSREAARWQEVVRKSGAKVQ